MVVTDAPILGRLYSGPVGNVGKLRRPLENGAPRFGIFDEPVGPIRPGDFTARSPLGGPAGWLTRRFGFKHFQFMGAVSPELFVGCALVWTGYLANTFVYVFEPGSRRMLRRGFESLGARGFRYNPDPDAGVSRFEKAGASVEMGAVAAGGRKRLAVRMGDLEIDLAFADGPPYEPMRICTRTGAEGWTYAQKVAGVAAEGRVRCEWGEFDLARLGACAHHDFTAGHLRRETFWLWSCLSGRGADGSRLGLNVSCGVNETSYSESCAWHDGRRIELAGVDFDFERDDLMKPWKVRSADRRLDLDFTPLGRYATRRNLIVAATDFQQIFGRFDGTLPGRDGPLEVRDLHGFSERQWVRW